MKMVTYIVAAVCLAGGTSYYGWNLKVHVEQERAREAAAASTTVVVVNQPAAVEPVRDLYGEMARTRVPTVSYKNITR